MFNNQMVVCFVLITGREAVCADCSMKSLQRVPTLLAFEKERMEVSKKKGCLVAHPT